MSSQLFETKYAFIRILSVGVLNMFIYLFCFYFLVPKFFKNRKYLLLILISIGIIFASYYLRLQIEKYFIPHLLHADKQIISYDAFKFLAILPQALIVLVACLVSVFKEVFNKELIYNATKLEESKRELELIKAKLNPHFLLNTLNNIYAINYEESPKTSEAIMQLSKVLSFTIYKSKSHLITLEEEVELMEALIGLYQLKYDNNLVIEFKKYSEKNEVEIPAFILFSLLENAFKHASLSTENSSFLNLNLKMEGGILSFDIENSISKHGKNENYLNGALGAHAIRQLLKDQYAEKFDYKILESQQSYRVSLKIYDL